MFRTIDRYILREIVLPILIGLVVFTFVLEIPVILRQGEDLVAKGVPWPTILHLLVLLLPAQLSLTIPMSLLLGVLVGFGRLSADREFVALQACGVSLGRLFRPLLLVSILATAGAAHQIIVALPASNQTYREITLGVVASRVERAVRPGVFFEDFPHMVIRVQNLPATGGWEGVLLADTSQPGRTTVYFAREGHIRLDREHRVVLLQLLDGWATTTYTDKPESNDNQHFESQTATLDPNTVFPPPPAKGATEMTFAELNEHTANALEHGDPGYVFRFMYQQKFALPATCPILALIGLALGASSRKDGKLASFVLGFGVVFAYYILLYLFRALSLGGRFPADWGPWMPNVIMLAAGLFLMTRRSRSADQPLRISIPGFLSGRRGRAASSASGSSTRSRAVLVVRLPHLNLPMPRMLDFYIARQYWRIVTIAVVALLGIFYISTFIDVADELARDEVTLKTLLQYFYYQTPQFVFFVLPIAVLVATLVTVAVMTKNSELIVMRACGVSLYRTMAPLVLFGALVAGVLFYAQERVLPGANREADRLNRLVRGFGPATSPFNQRWMIGRTGVIYRYNLFDSNQNHFVNLWTYEVSKKDWRLASITYATDVTLMRPDPGKPNYAEWRGTKGWERHFEIGKGKSTLAVSNYLPFPERKMSIETPDYFASRVIETEQMSYDQMLSFNELRGYIDQLRSSGANAVPYVVALHRKIAFPLVTIIMTMLAVPFAASGGRKGALYGIGVGIVLALGYFVTMSVFGALGSGGVLSPFFAAWAPNLLFTAAAVYMILTVRT